MSSWGNTELCLCFSTSTNSLMKLARNPAPAYLVYGQDQAIAVFNRRKRLKFWTLFDGYRDLCKPLPSALDVRDLFKACDKAGLVTEAGIFFIQEED